MEQNSVENVTVVELQERWAELSDDERYRYFGGLPRPEAEELFLTLTAIEQADLIIRLDPTDRRSWIRLLAPDDAADVVQNIAKDQQPAILDLLDVPTRNEVTALLLFSEDVAGGLMNPRFARLRPEMTADEAIHYLQRQSREQAEWIYYAYIVDSEQTLLGLVSFRDLCLAAGTSPVSEIMRTDVVSVSEQTDQEEISRIFAESDLLAIPVLDGEGRIRGVVTIDDIVDVVHEEATEDIQKLGGSEALDAPYLRTRLWPMVNKRGGWLLVLFLGEMATASAMGYFENEIAKAVVLALFIPLIISSGGNSGSQATTLVIRAMALGEVRMRDIGRVAGREIIVGFILGCLLGLTGFLRVVLWQCWGLTNYGAHYLMIAATVLCSVVGVVMWGTLSGAVLPFILRACRIDPATASTPFVATLVDVTGLVIYFSTASIILHGTLL